MFNHTFSEEIPPNVQPTSLLLQLETILWPCCWLLGRRSWPPLGYNPLSESWRECWDQTWAFSAPGFEQPGQGEAVPACGHGEGTWWSLMFLPTKPFYDFVIQCKVQETQPGTKICHDAQGWAKRCSGGEGLGSSPQEGSPQLSLSQLITEVCSLLSYDGFELG